MCAVSPVFSESINLTVQLWQEAPCPYNGSDVLLNVYGAVYLHCRSKLKHSLQGLGAVPAQASSVYMRIFTVFVFTQECFKVLDNDGCVI